MSYSKMKVPDLKEILKSKGLSITGKKSDLVERLEALEEQPTTKKQKLGKEEITEISKEKQSNLETFDPNFLIEHLKDPSWRKILAPEFQKEYFKELQKNLFSLKKKNVQIFPPENEIFNAFNLTPFDEVKVVIIGQDPYHDDGQAHGLCFSVRNGVKPPPSLVNIYKELSTDIEGFTKPTHGNLEKWAKQGIFLLNATLTVEAHKANSHSNIGWQEFTDSVIKALNEKDKKICFVLWGGFAQKKGKIINQQKHCCINAAHPSPLSVNKFLGSKCFSKVNEFLKKSGEKEIDWKL